MTNRATGHPVPQGFILKKNHRVDNSNITLNTDTTLEKRTSSVEKAKCKHEDFKTRKQS